MIVSRDLIKENVIKVFYIFDIFFVLYNFKVVIVFKCYKNFFIYVIYWFFFIRGIKCKVFVFFFSIDY